MAVVLKKIQLFFKLLLIVHQSKPSRLVSTALIHCFSFYKSVNSFLNGLLLPHFSINSFSIQLLLPELTLVRNVIFPHNHLLFAQHFLGI